MAIPILGDIIGAVKDVVSEVVVDKDKRNEINYKLQELEDKADQRLHEQLMGQIEVNKTEAEHSSVFVAGWRPFIGWGCGAAFIYNAILAPMTGWASADLPFVQTVLMGMLGLGAMRSYEKVKGVATTSITKSSLTKNKKSGDKADANSDKQHNSKPPKHRWKKI